MTTAIFGNLTGFTNPISHSNLYSKTPISSQKENETTSKKEKINISNEAMQESLNTANKRYFGSLTRISEDYYRDPEKVFSTIDYAKDDEEETIFTQPLKDITSEMDEIRASIEQATTEY